MTPHSLSTKMNCKTTVLNCKTSPPTPFCGHHKCKTPMLYQMRNTNEGWSLFYQIFETSLQLAILFIFLKLLTFSGATFSSRFLCQGFLNFLFFFFFFFVSCTIYRWLLFCCLSFFCGHIHLLNSLGNSNCLIGTIYRLCLH